MTRRIVYSTSLFPLFCGNPLSFSSVVKSRWTSTAGHLFPHCSAVNHAPSHRLYKVAGCPQPYGNLPQLKLAQARAHNNTTIPIPRIFLEDTGKWPFGNPALRQRIDTVYASATGTNQKNIVHNHKSSPGHRNTDNLRTGSHTHLSQANDNVGVILLRQKLTDVATTTEPATTVQCHLTL